MPDREIRFIESALAKLFAQVEKERSVIVGSAVRAFARDVILESLQFRQDAWKGFGLDVRSREQLSKAIEQSVNSCASLVWKSSTYTSPEGQKYILLYGLLQQIKEQWCNIFPIC